MQNEEYYHKFWYQKTRMAWLVLTADSTRW